MAAAPTISVIVEQAIHKTLKDQLQQIFDAHKIRVKRIDVDWIDISTTVEDKSLIASIELQTASK